MAISGSKRDFWHLEQKYPNLRRCGLKLTALFGFTYLCEMKIMKSKHCSTMTDGHLVACLRVATICYCPDYDPVPEVPLRQRIIQLPPRCNTHCLPTVRMSWKHQHVQSVLNFLDDDLLPLTNQN